MEADIGWIDEVKMQREEGYNTVQEGTEGRTDGGGKKVRIHEDRKKAERRVGRLLQKVSYPIGKMEAERKVPSRKDGGRKYGTQ